MPWWVSAGIGFALAVVVGVLGRLSPKKDWEFIKTFSPYHLVDPEGTYPPILLSTSTRDDRVHPGHARKMAALLSRFGHDVTYWENIEGGHGMAADATQQATMLALAYTFLDRHLRARP